MITPKALLPRPKPEPEKECAPCHKAATVTVLVEACKADSAGLDCEDKKQLALNGEMDIDGLTDWLEKSAKDPDTKRVARTVRRYRKR